MKCLLLGKIGGGERLLVSLGDDGGLVVLVGLPEDHLHFVKREILLAEKFDMLVVKAGLPSFVVSLLNPLPVSIGQPLSGLPDVAGEIIELRFVRGESGMTVR